MNSIPLIKGNTPQEINTSIIALKKALSELEAQDRLLQGTDKDVQDKIKQINELIEGINTHLGTVDTHLGTVDTHLTTIDGQITALQPVDTVTSGNMHSVTSNAVHNEIINYFSSIPVVRSTNAVQSRKIGMINFAVGTIYVHIGNAGSCAFYFITNATAFTPTLITDEGNAFARITFSFDYANSELTITVPEGYWIAETVAMGQGLTRYTN